MSSIDISRQIADLFEAFHAPFYRHMDRAKIIREINDTLQSRSDMSVNMLLSAIRETCGPEYAIKYDIVQEKIKAFQVQKALRGKSYTRIGNQEYQYNVWDFDPRHPLKIVDQALFDHAAEYGFPPGFFKGSFFDHVTVYCMPDGVDCSGSHFQDCTFAVCGIRGAVFDNATFYSSEFHSSLLHMVNFSEASIANTHFRDCDLMSVSFQDARLKSCLTVDCSMKQIDFQNAFLDGASFGRIRASRILNLPSTTITQGGATTKTVWNLRASIFRELGVSMFPARQHPPINRRKKVSAPER